LKCRVFNKMPEAPFRMHFGQNFTAILANSILARCNLRRSAH